MTNHPETYQKHDNNASTSKPSTSSRNNSKKEPPMSIQTNDPLEKFNRLKSQIKNTMRGFRSQSTYNYKKHPDKTTYQRPGDLYAVTTTLGYKFYDDEFSPDPKEYYPVLPHLKIPINKRQYFSHHRVSDPDWTVPPSTKVGKEREISLPKSKGVKLRDINEILSDRGNPQKTIEPSRPLSVPPASTTPVAKPIDNLPDPIKDILQTITKTTSTNPTAPKAPGSAPKQTNIYISKSSNKSSSSTSHQSTSTKPAVTRPVKKTKEPSVIKTVKENAATPPMNNNSRPRVSSKFVPTGKVKAAVEDFIEFRKYILAPFDEVAIRDFSNFDVPPPVTEDMKRPILKLYIKGGPPDIIQKIKEQKLANEKLLAKKAKLKSSKNLQLNKKQAASDVENIKSKSKSKSSIKQKENMSRQTTISSSSSSTAINSPSIYQDTKPSKKISMQSSDKLKADYDSPIKRRETTSENGSTYSIASTINTPSPSVKMKDTTSSKSSNKRAGTTISQTDNNREQLIKKESKSKPTSTKSSATISSPSVKSKSVTSNTSSSTSPAVSTSSKATSVSKSAEKPVFEGNYSADFLKSIKIPKRSKVKSNDMELEEGEMVSPSPSPRATENKRRSRISITSNEDEEPAPKKHQTSKEVDNYTLSRRESSLSSSVSRRERENTKKRESSVSPTLSKKSNYDEEDRIRRSSRQRSLSKSRSRSRSPSKRTDRERSRRESSKETSRDRSRRDSSAGPALSSSSKQRDRRDSESRRSRRDSPDIPPRHRTSSLRNEIQGDETNSIVNKDINNREISEKKTIEPASPKREVNNSSTLSNVHIAASIITTSTNRTINDNIRPTGAQTKTTTSPSVTPSTITTTTIRKTRPTSPLSARSVSTKMSPSDASTSTILSATAPNAETQEQYKIFVIMFKNLAHACKKRGDIDPYSVSGTVDHFYAFCNYILNFYYMDKSKASISFQNLLRAWKSLFPFVETLLKKLKSKEMNDLYFLAVRLMSLIRYYIFDRMRSANQPMLSSQAVNYDEATLGPQALTASDELLREHFKAQKLYEESEAGLSLGQFAIRFPETFNAICIRGDFSAGISLGGEAGVKVEATYPFAPFCPLHHAAISSKCILAEYVKTNNIGYTPIQNPEEFM